MAKRIYIAGHGGMVGSALARQLADDSNNEIITRSRSELNLVDQQQVTDFFATEKIDEVYLAAAKVGGIHAHDTYPADFIYDNLMVECNVIHQAWRNGVNKLLFQNLRRRRIRQVLLRHLRPQGFEGRFQCGNCDC